MTSVAFGEDLRSGVGAGVRLIGCPEHRQQIGRPMRAAFATNASIGVCPISAIDGHYLDPDHPAVAGLQRPYAAIPSQRI